MLLLFLKRLINFEFQIVLVNREMFLIFFKELILLSSLDANKYFDLIERCFENGVSP